MLRKSVFPPELLGSCPCRSSVSISLYQGITGHHLSVLYSTSNRRFWRHGKWEVNSSNENLVDSENDQCEWISWPDSCQKHCNRYLTNLPLSTIEGTEVIYLPFFQQVSDTSLNDRADKLDLSINKALPKMDLKHVELDSHAHAHTHTHTQCFREQRGGGADLLRAHCHTSTTQTET